MSIDRAAEEEATKKWKKPRKPREKKEKQPVESSSVEKKKKEPEAPFDYQKYADESYAYVTMLFNAGGYTGKDYDLFFKHSLPWMERIQEIECERAVPSAKPEHYKEYLRKWMRAWQEVFARHAEYKSGVLK